jgi:hypothetical protein
MCLLALRKTINLTIFFYLLRKFPQKTETISENSCKQITLKLGMEFWGVLFPTISIIALPNTVRHIYWIENVLESVALVWF